jgi:hypothetical protein
MKLLNRILTDIAVSHLNIPTLRTRRSDRLDFHDVSVWAVRSALKAAYDAGSTNAPAAANARSDLPIPFDRYEIHGVREFGRGKSRHCEQVADEEAQFWSLYGHIPGQGVECIGDFKSREFAEEVYARITGKPYDAR